MCLPTDTTPPGNASSVADGVCWCCCSAHVTCDDFFYYTHGKLQRRRRWCRCRRKCNTIVRSFVVRCAVCFSLLCWEGAVFAEAPGGCDGIQARVCGAVLTLTHAHRSIMLLCNWIHNCSAKCITTSEHHIMTFLLCYLFSIFTIWFQIGLILVCSTYFLFCHNTYNHYWPMY